MSQTTGYDFGSATGFAGDIVDMGNHHIESYAAEGVIEFGAPAQLGSNPDKQVAPFAGGIFAGVAKFVQNVTGNYPDKDSVAVVDEGRVRVNTLAVDVDAGEAAYVTNAGEWTNQSSGATKVGKFKTSGAGIVIVDLIKG